MMRSLELSVPGRSAVNDWTVELIQICACSLRKFANLFSNGWPNPSSNDEQKRTEIAVSIAAPNKIVALATGAANGGSGLYGIYISYDKGENWTFRCC